MAERVVGKVLFTEDDSLVVNSIIKRITLGSEKSEVTDYLRYRLSSPEQTDLCKYQENQRVISCKYTLENWVVIKKELLVIFGFNEKDQLDEVRGKFKT